MLRKIACVLLIGLVLSYPQVFVANPNKPHEIKVILSKNHEKLVSLLHDLSGGKGNPEY